MALKYGKCSIIVLISALVISVSSKVSSRLAIAQNTGNLVSDLDWSPNGEWIAHGIGRWEQSDYYGTIYPILLCESDISLRVGILAVGGPSRINVAGLLCSSTTVDFDSTGSRLAYTSNGRYGLISVLEEAVGISVLGGAFYQSMTWHPSGDRVLLTSDQGNGVLASDIISAMYGGMSWRNYAELVRPFLYSIWSPDGSLFAVSTADGRIYVWDGTQVLQVFTLHMAPVRRFVWNAATNLIASGDDDGRVLVWNPDSGEVVRELTGHTGPILDIDWSADGTQIATAGLDNTLRVWDWPSGDSVIVRSGVLTSAVAYSPDGTQLAYGGEITDPSDVVIDIIPIPVIDLPTDTPTPTSTFTPPPTPSPIPLPPANTNLLTNPSFASGLAPWNTVNFSAGGVVNGAWSRLFVLL